MYCPECGAKCVDSGDNLYTCEADSVIWEYVADGYNGPAYYMVEKG